jgi:two-component system phosphate regulon sensor histidine kinase PhoR
VPNAFRRLLLASLVTAAFTIVAALTLAPWLAIVMALAAAFFIAWRIAGPFSRRLQTVIKMARHYASADLPRWPADYGDDDIGQIIRAMDEAVQDHKRRLSEFGRQRARMEAILAEMAEGVLVVDRQGRVQLINEAAQRLLAGRVAVGDHYIETLRHPSVVAELTGALRGERPDPLEVPLESDRRSLLAHATPASESAGGGAVLVLHDITALRTADRIRRDFVANVSHELRTPLTAVRGYVEALGDDGLSREERHEFLDIVTRHTYRMERLVRDLLRLARIEAGQERLDIGECRADLMFRTVASELAAPIQARALRVETHITQDAQVVIGDAAKLQDALRNLIENATTYSPQGGRIELHATLEGQWVALSVGDEGPGIPDRDLARVFERFYRVDKSRSRDSGDSGTGLGLSIAKHLVELHGGRVRVENRQPHGALFTIYLPRSPHI